MITLIRVATVRWALFLACFVAIFASTISTATAIPEPSSLVTLAWDANEEPDVKGYRLRYGTNPGLYPNVVDVGNNLTATIDMPGPGTYYAVVAAYNTASLESLPSNEVQFTVTLPDQEIPFISGIPGDIGKNAFLASIDFDFLSLRFCHNRYLQGVTLVVECSEDIVAWYPVAILRPQSVWQTTIPGVEIINEPVGDRDYITIKDTIGRKNIGFYRMIIEVERDTVTVGVR